MNQRDPHQDPDAPPPEDDPPENEDEDEDDDNDSDRRGMVLVSTHVSPQFRQLYVISRRPEEDVVEGRRTLLSLSSERYWHALHAPYRENQLRQRSIWAWGAGRALPHIVVDGLDAFLQL